MKNSPRISSFREKKGKKGGMPLCCSDLAWSRLHFEHKCGCGKARQNFSSHFMFIFKAKNSNNHKWSKNFLWSIGL